MPYTTNPNLPKVRARAIELMRKHGWSVRQTARYFGFNPSTISKWNRKIPPGGSNSIPTESSRPKSHPKKLTQTVVERIIELRKNTGGRCSEVIHGMLEREGVLVSLNSVKRTLDRQYLLKKKSKWKKLHFTTPRPEAIKPGDLVQIDTIHLRLPNNKRIYVYTLIDVNSRWTYAYASRRLRAGISLEVVKKAMKISGFEFNCIQSDHGPEFSQHFTKMLGIRHRHSRIRKPNDNAHVERFNRTIQTEFLNKLEVDVRVINRKLPKYLKYYNEQRLHLGIKLKTPIEILNECCQAIG
jgi:transposase InsO family protein